jgi:hypothetical protein
MKGHGHASKSGKFTTESPACSRDSDRFANKFPVKPNCPPLTSKASAANDAHGPEDAAVSGLACSNPRPPALASYVDRGDVARFLAPTRHSPLCA